MSDSDLISDFEFSWNPGNFGTYNENETFGTGISPVSVFINCDDEIQEAIDRVLKVPSPRFVMNRLKKGQPSFLITGSDRSASEGLKFLLINERLKKGEPTVAWGRVSFTVGRQFSNIKDLSKAEQDAIDPLVIREFNRREGPLWLLKFKLINSFATPKELSAAPPGRFSSKIEFSEAIIRFIPGHKKYVEPFAETDYVLSRKKPSETEVLSNKDISVVKSFQENQNEKGVGRLNKVRIYAKDFRRIINQEDGFNTFFYLDPPRSNKLSLTNEDIREAVKNIQGKFIISLPDTQSVCEAFKSYQIKKISSLDESHKEIKLFISNFPLNQSTLWLESVQDQGNDFTVEEII